MYFGYDFAQRCPKVQMAQLLRGMFDLFSNAASAPGAGISDEDEVGGDYGSDAVGLTALGWYHQQSVEKTAEGVS
jgi:hypothetical protein